MKLEINSIDNGRVHGTFGLTSEQAKAAMDKMQPIIMEHRDIKRIVEEFITMDFTTEEWLFLCFCLGRLYEKNNTMEASPLMSMVKRFSNN